MSNPLAYFVDDEWRRVCGPYVKPPKMGRWKMMAAPVMDLSDSGRIAEDMLRQIDRAMKPRQTLMEQAVRMVFVLGYGPSDCMIQYQHGTDDLREPSIEVDRLLVRGEPCFEVKVERSPAADWHITYTTTPRLIAWPAPLSDSGATLLFDHHKPTNEGIQ